MNEGGFTMEKTDFCFLAVIRGKTGTRDKSLDSAFRKLSPSQEQSGFFVSSCGLLMGVIKATSTPPRGHGSGS